MSLVVLLIIPAVGGLVAWAVSRWRADASRWVALLAVLASLALAVSLWVRDFGGAGGSGPLPAVGPFVYELDVSWIPQTGIRFHIAADGLSLIMLILTFAVVALALLADWKRLDRRPGLHCLMLLWAAASLAGVFMALDLFLFYFFFELMLVPFFFLIALWGHERRRKAALKFLIYTQAGGLLMLVSIVALYFVHGRQTGVYSFDYLQLLGGGIGGWTGRLLMAGFFVAFAVKLPAVPLHGWLPDAHSQADTSGSVLLAGLLIKVGAYGFVRFLVPLFPGAAFDVRYLAMGLGVAGILYGAVMAFSQTDLKRMVAYTSVSHMGFVLLGVFAWNRIALHGVILQIVCHAFSTGGLFILAGALEERLGTRDLSGMGGLWARLSALGGVGTVLAMAALGLPGLGNFVAEFLILLGTFAVSKAAAIVGSLGLIVSTVYAVWLVQRVFHGPDEAWAHVRLPRLTPREVVMFLAAIVVLLWLGLYPQTLIRTVEPSADYLLRSAPTTDTSAAGTSAVDTTTGGPSRE